ncbi:MAG: hypothetical protein IJV77_04060, partial [Clostridia bacterium]|nr:hypothetical protein [Clostridia bacterium]
FKENNNVVNTTTWLDVGNHTITAVVTEIDNYTFSEASLAVNVSAKTIALYMVAGSHEVGAESVENNPEKIVSFFADEAYTTAISYDEMATKYGISCGLQNYNNTVVGNYTITISYTNTNYNITPSNYIWKGGVDTFAVTQIQIEIDVKLTKEYNGNYNFAYSANNDDCELTTFKATRTSTGADLTSEFKAKLATIEFTANDKDVVGRDSTVQQQTISLTWTDNTADSYYIIVNATAKIVAKEVVLSVATTNNTGVITKDYDANNTFKFAVTKADGMIESAPETIDLAVAGATNVTTANEGKYAVTINSFSGFASVLGANYNVKEIKLDLPDGATGVYAVTHVKVAPKAVTVTITGSKTYDGTKDFKYDASGTQGWKVVSAKDSNKLDISAALLADLLTNFDKDDIAVASDKNVATANKTFATFPGASAYSANYTIEWVSGAVTINAKDVVITLTAGTRPYGYADGYTTSANVISAISWNSDVANDSVDLAKLSYSRETDQSQTRKGYDDVGAYDIINLSYSDTNYNVTEFIKNKYTITTNTDTKIMGNVSEHVGVVTWDIANKATSMDYKNVAYLAFWNGSEWMKYSDITIQKGQKVGGTFKETNLNTETLLASNTTIGSEEGENINVVHATKTYLYVKLQTVELDGTLYTLEDALNKATASSKVIVRHSTQTADSDAATALYNNANYRTIKTSAMLILPYDANNSNNGLSSPSGLSLSGGLGTGVHADRQSNAKPYVELILNTGFVLTNNGTINIGGTIHANGKKAATGHTGGAYAQITMETNARIDNYATMNVYGYIKAATKQAFDSDKDSDANTTTPQVVSHGGSITVPFVIYDYRGGSLSSKLNSQNPKVFPFNMYDFHNVQIPLTIKHGSTLNAMAKLFASATYQGGTVAMIDSSSGIFRLGAGSSLTLKYQPDWSTGKSLTVVGCPNVGGKPTAGYT